MFLVAKILKFISVVSCKYMWIKTTVASLKDFVLLMMYYGKIHHTPPSLQLYGEILLLPNPMSERKISIVSVHLYFHIDFLLSLDYSCYADCRVSAHNFSGVLNIGSCG